MIPAEQALRSLLALKLIGKERKSHVMNLVFDKGLALFAGRQASARPGYKKSHISPLLRPAARISARAKQ